MNNWTGGDIATVQERLESAAATLLGKAIFEIGRLEMDLALFLVWSDEGRNLELLTTQIADDGLHAKLCNLEQRAIQKYGGNETALVTFKSWLKVAHEIRIQRNEFVHGRWGVAATEDQVINIIGIPTSDKQREVRYSIDQLKASIDAMKSVRDQLRQLRSKWPL